MMITTKINQDATAFHQRRGEVPLESRSQVPSEDVLSRNPFMATLRTVRRERLWSPTLDPSSRLLPLFLTSSSSPVGHASGRSILACSCVCLSIALLYKVIIVIQLTPVGFIVFICSFFVWGLKSHDFLIQWRIMLADDREPDWSLLVSSVVVKNGTL